LLVCCISIFFAIFESVLIIAVLPTSIFFKVPGADAFFYYFYLRCHNFSNKKVSLQKEPVARVLISF
jgi:hypothetical protein